MAATPLSGGKTKKDHVMIAHTRIVGERAAFVAVTVSRGNEVRERHAADELHPNVGLKRKLDL